MFLCYFSMEYENTIHEKKFTLKWLIIIVIIILCYVIVQIMTECGKPKK